MAVINFIEKTLTVRNLGVHKHNYWELIYVISGSGKFIFSDNSTINYVKGDIICIPPHIEHTNYADPDFKNINATFINWIPKFNKQKLISISQNTEKNYSSDLFYLFDLTYRYFHGVDRDMLVLNNLIDLLLSFIESKVQAPIYSATSKIIESKIIQNYIYHDFDLDKIYAELFYSKRYLQRLFIKEYGISPSKFLMSQRLNTSLK